MNFKITINKKDFSAKLADSEPVRQLAEQLPAERDFKRSGNHEFFCRLGTGLDVSGQTGTSDIHKNGIYFFDGWKALSFVYKDMNISPYKVVWLGDFSEDVCRTLEESDGRISVRMEAAR
jgi:hypothetical protein